MYRLAFIGVVAVVAMAAGLDTPSRPKVDVAALVRQLGSDDFKQREEAERQLSALKVDEVPPELLAALKSPNAEVRERAARAAKALRDRIALGKVPRGEKFAKRGQIDLYVASTAAGHADAKADDPRLWNPALDIGRAAIKVADLKGARLPRCPARLKDVAEYKKNRKAWFTRVDEPYTKYRRVYPEAIQAPSVAGQEGFQFHIVVSRGPVKTGGSNMSLILATGDIDCGDMISESVVICDGDVRVGERVSSSLIVARGSISIKGDAYTSTLIAGGSVRAKVPDPPVLIPGNDQDTKDRNKFALEDYERVRVDVREKQTNPLGFITFFELHRVGLEVKAEKGEVTVAKVALGSACEKAGLKVGDVVLEAGGKKPSDAESLRRLLRDALAVGDATIKLKRGDKTETVKLSLPD